MDSLIKIHWSKACIVPLYWKLFAKLLLKSCIVVTQSLLYMEKAAFISIRTSAACRFGVSQVNLYCTWLCVLYSTYMYCIKLLLPVGLEFHRSIYCKWLCVLYTVHTHDFYSKGIICKTILPLWYKNCSSYIFTRIQSHKKVYCLSYEVLI